MRGHTNNAADNLLNLLKGAYHNRDIFTYEELLKILDEDPKVEATIMNPEEFIGYNQFFSFYKTPYSGSVTRNCVFTEEAFHKYHIVL